MRLLISLVAIFGLALMLSFGAQFVVWALDTGRDAAVMLPAFPACLP